MTWHPIELELRLTEGAAYELRRDLMAIVARDESRAKPLYGVLLEALDDGLSAHRLRGAGFNAIVLIGSGT